MAKKTGIKRAITKVKIYSPLTKLGPKRTAKVFFPDFLSVGSSLKLFMDNKDIAKKPGPIPAINTSIGNSIV